MFGYRIYTRDEIEQKVALSREKQYPFYFTHNGIEFCVVWSPYFQQYANVQHLEFYAMSRGAEAYTDTGYRSNFVTYFGEGGALKPAEDAEKNIERTRDDIFDLYRQLLDDAGAKKAPVQSTIFDFLNDGGCQCAIG